MVIKSKQDHYKCDYKNCKAVIDYESSLGNFCSYHLGVLRKKMKKDFKAKKVNLTYAQRRMLKKYRLMGNVEINIKGGEK